MYVIIQNFIKIHPFDLNIMCKKHTNKGALLFLLDNVYHLANQNLSFFYNNSYIEELKIKATKLEQSVDPDLDPNCMQR